MAVGLKVLAGTASVTALGTVSVTALEAVRGRELTNSPKFWVEGLERRKRVRRSI